MQLASHYDEDKSCSSINKSIIDQPSNQEADSLVAFISDADPEEE